MTGVADVFKVTRATVVTMVEVMHLVLFAVLPSAIAARIECALFPYWHVYLLRMGVKRCPGLAMPDPRPSLRLNGIIEIKEEKDEESDDDEPTQQKQDKKKSTTQQCGEDDGRSCFEWALLLPLTSRGAFGGMKDSNDDLEPLLVPSSTTMVDDSATSPSDHRVWQGLEWTAHQLVHTIPMHRRASTRVFIAIDMKDPVFDSTSGRVRLNRMFSELGLEVDIAPALPPAYHGAICWIWTLLARRAVSAGADFFVLLGDDVELKMYDWQSDVEAQFERISRERRLPFGFGCVAIRDESFEVFPSFPVMHRKHLEVFGDELFPRELRNQHGDPYVFELYRRWGASRYTDQATLRNAIGGRDTARYRKRSDILWRDDLLTSGIMRLEDYLWMNEGLKPGTARVPCLDVVVPTFRCDLDMLGCITGMPTSLQQASIHMTIVVDNPDTPHLEEIVRLRSYAADRTVRVHVNSENVGAPAARNIGLAQSFGDWAILLDDDVIPDDSLLDAYLGAIKRQPYATAFVGLTRLSPPVSLWESAMLASRICFFYGISEETDQPSWGVTANICVPCRTNNTVWFSDRYPRSGGGEDVDFCMRLQKQAKRGSTFVAVPGAKVLHPFWERPLAQVCGWARGDVMCLGALPQSTFRTFPNWAETSLVCALMGYPKLVVLAALVEVVMLTPRYAISASELLRDNSATLGKKWWSSRIVVGLAATVPPMLQDAVRLGSKLTRLRLGEVCLNFDWMGGQGQHIRATQLASAVRTTVFLLLAATTIYDEHVAFLLLSSAAIIWVLWASVQIAASSGPAPILEVARTARVAESARAAASSMSNGKARSSITTTTVHPGLFCLPPSCCNPGGSCGNNVRPFIVLAYQRTGSNHLCSLLDVKTGGLPVRFVMHYEILNERAAFMRDNIAIRDPIALRNRDEDVVRFVADAFNDCVLPDCGVADAVGFKIFPEHICGSQESYDAVERLLADPRIVKIVLRRENCLAVATSMLRAAMTGKYMRLDTDKLKVHIRPDDFDVFCRKYDDYYGFLHESLTGQSYVELTYEQLVDDTVGTIRRVVAGIVGMERVQSLEMAGFPFSPNSAVRRQSSASTRLRDVITNYDELKLAFKNTRYASCFDDDEMTTRRVREGHGWVDGHDGSFG